MDGDGLNEPDSEEYMDNKDKAIKKAMKDESLDPDNRDQVDQPDDPAKDGEEMKESSQSNPHNVDGNNPNGGEEPAKDGEELKELKRSLKDVGGVVGIPALGQFARNLTGKK